MNDLRSLLSICAALSASGAATPALADIGISYQLIETFALPQGAFDLLPDGRLIAIDGQGTVSIQSAPNSSLFTLAGSVGQVNANAFWPSFVSVSPNGTTLAIGNNEFNAANAVLFFDASEALSGLASPLSSITAPNFAGTWAGSDTFYVSGAEAANFATGVFRLDVANGTSTEILAPAGTFSAGVSIANGSLLAGEGDTGNVYAFDLATLGVATDPVSIASGTLIASHSSAGAIDTDPYGNIIIAGGAFDFATGQITGSAAVIDPITQEKLVLTPAGTSTFYNAYFNEALNQLVVTAGGTAYVYAVPAPASAALLALGLLATPRRRRL